MTFEKDGVKFTVKDRAQIDCMIAKGWTPVKEKKANEKPEIKRGK